MKRAKVKVRDAKGLHLTPSAKVVRCAQQFKSQIVLCHECKEADACSILQVLSLGAPFDGGERGLAFSSGMAAIDCLLRLLKAGVFGRDNGDKIKGVG